MGRLDSETTCHLDCEKRSPKLRFGMTGRKESDRLAVTYLQNGIQLAGLSTDKKPVDKIPGGSLFLELDTGRWFILSGENWVPKADRAQLLLARETDKAVTAGTGILEDCVAPTDLNTRLAVLTDTAGIVSLEVDGALGALFGGAALDPEKWYFAEIPIPAGAELDLQFSAAAVLQICWIGGD